MLKDDSYARLDMQRNSEYALVFFSRFNMSYGATVGASAPNSNLIRLKK